MSNSKTANKILEKWIASLKDRDRSRASISNNFEELFHEMNLSSVDADTAKECLDSAVKAHLPSPGLARKIYKDLKFRKMTESSEKEFIDEWHKYIKDCAVQAFYAFYDDNEVRQEEEKKYGNMSAKEYRAQRKYASSFPKVDLEALRKKAKDIEEALKNDNDEDLLKLLEGGKDGKPS